MSQEDFDYLDKLEQIARENMRRGFPDVPILGSADILRLVKLARHGAYRSEDLVIKIHGGQDVEEHARSFNEGYSLAVFHALATDEQLESPPEQIPPVFKATVFGSTPEIRAVLLSPLELDVRTAKIYLDNGRQISHGLTRQEASA